jgi:hypothetical protein
MVQLMKTLLALLAFTCAAHASDATITAAERAHAIQLLEGSQKEFLSLVDGLTDAQWKFKTAPDRWSVGETAEHIMLAEARLFAGAQGALAAPPNPDWEAKTRGKTEFLEKALVDRSHKAQAPEPIQPQAKLSREEVIARYKEGRARTLKFVEETEAPLKEHTADHPFPIFGTLNAYQWIIYIPLHNLRHNQQIAEVKASAGFPH